MTEGEQNRLIIENMGLVPTVAADYRGVTVDFEDLLATGRVGLVKAARTFKEDRGSSFSAWAANCIRSEIMHAVRDERDETVLPTDMIAFDSDHIEKIEEWDSWGDRGNASAICERWSKLDTSPEDLSLWYEAIKQEKAKFDAAFISLTGNQRKLISWVYLNDPPLPIVAAARQLGVPYRRAITMINKALRTMRQIITRMEQNRISGAMPTSPLLTETPSRQRSRKAI